MNEDAVVARLQASRKYRHLAETTLRRVAAWAIARSRTQREAEERARRKLHQVFGAWLGGFDAGKAAKILDAAGHDDREEAYRRILAMHASTRERLPLLPDFYRAIWNATGAPRSVLDLGCGLSPIALPWMDLPDGCVYRASEIDDRLVALGNRALALGGRPPLVACRDLLGGVPEEPGDVILLLKMLPTLEQQEAGAGLRLLRESRARYLVASFPSRSLGGRDRGMAAHYEAVMERLLHDSGRTAVKIGMGNEKIFVLPGASPG